MTFEQSESENMARTIWNHSPVWLLYKYSQYKHFLNYFDDWGHYKQHDHNY